MKNKDENDNIIEHYKDNKLTTGNIILIVGCILIILYILFKKFFNFFKSDGILLVLEIIVVAGGIVSMIIGTIMSSIGY
jgi:CHASE3 domain sensor protein